jgi:hypothetical protein
MQGVLKGVSIPFQGMSKKSMWDPETKSLVTRSLESLAAEV